MCVCHPLKDGWQPRFFFSEEQNGCKRRGLLPEHNYSIIHRKCQHSTCHSCMSEFEEIEPRIPHWNDRNNWSGMLAINPKLSSSWGQNWNPTPFPQFCMPLYWVAPLNSPPPGDLLLPTPPPPVLIDTPALATMSPLLFLISRSCLGRAVTPVHWSPASLHLCPADKAVCFD